MERILDEFKDNFGDYPDLIQFDEGPEFLNPEVKKLLADREVHYFWTLVRRTGYHLRNKPNKEGERPYFFGTYTLFERKAAVFTK